MEQTGWDRWYPRPQLRRERYMILDRGWTLNGRPIQLPWPPQAALSGFEGEVGDTLRYKTGFVPPDWALAPGQRVLLHFGAVDQVSEVRLNGVPVGRHEGGYLPFTLDITDALRKKANQLEVTAVDTLSHRYPYGKQHKKPHGMWYTPVSGIWQTVWLEAVPEKGAVRGLKITPDLQGVTLEADTGGAAYTVSVPLEDGQILTAIGREGRVRLDIPRPHLWTPEDPFLYGLTVTTAADRAESYFALRTVGIEQREGMARLCLNGEPVFLHGVLDQGYFHDGLYLPKTPGEYERDILRMKELGFNTLRKHAKVEPEAFYAACDRQGMLVIQDMVNSGGYNWLLDTAIPTVLSKKRPDRLPGSKARRDFFQAHTLETVKRLYSHPCIVGWTLFNEGWGQYDSDRLYRLCRRADRTRFWDSTSGWFAQKESDVESVHVYFRNELLRAGRADRPLLLSECGGYSRRVEGHVDERIKNYGYGKTDTEEQLTGQIQTLFEEMVFPSIPQGLCGCIYTQLSDVEGETNGLYTYDRAVCKVDPDAMRQIAARLTGKQPAPV